MVVSDRSLVDAGPACGGAARERGSDPTLVGAGPAGWGEELSLAGRALGGSSGG